MAEHSVIDRRPEIPLRPRQPIAIVRLSDLTHAVPLSRALIEGGIKAIEFTLTNRAAIEAIKRVRVELPGEAVIGVGTVLTAEEALESVLAGADFLVTPAYVPDVIETGLEHGVPVVCGAFTPTEIVTAWQAGASLIKVFPIRRMGPEYIKDLRGPLPDIPLVPTGGVDLANCARLLDAGAYTVAIGSSLVDPRRVAEQDWHGLASMAGRYVEACNLSGNGASSG